MSEPLDSMKLPQRSIQEELEQLSRDKLRPLFSQELFLIREETLKDKGIDLSIELRYKNVHTNFRFIVQLKATQSKKANNDDTYSFQIETSNIQYLLNSGLPAYYITYIKQEDCFYYENLQDFVNRISQNKKLWIHQGSHTLRTAKKLDKNSISKIYQEVKERCQLSRELIEKIPIKGTGVDSKKISVNSGYKITDESSIVQLTEKIGFTIINEGRSKEVVSLNEKVSNDIKSSLYNLIVGIACYYTSNFYDALAHFRKSRKFKTELSQDYKQSLEYFDGVVKFSLGLLSEKDYKEKINQLKNSIHLKYYIELDEIKGRYINSSYNDEAFKNFKNDIEALVKSSEDTKLIQLTIKCEYILFLGKKINLDFFQSVCKLNAQHLMGMNTFDLRKEQAEKFIAQKKKWISFCRDIDLDISERTDNFSFCFSSLNQCKVNFEFIVMSFLLSQNGTVESTLPENEESLQTILKNLKQVSSYYRSIQHIENLLAVLSTQYEIYVFKKNSKASQSTASEMEELIEFYELKESKSKFDFLINGGTTSEQLESLFSANLNTKKNQDEYNSLINEMKAIDALEEKERPKNNAHETVVVDLFPIQYFEIDKSRLETFYKILKIENPDLIENLNFFFDNGIVPILNILTEVKTEGPLNGNLESKGIDSWRKIKNIRLALYKNKFYRQINN